MASNLGKMSYTAHLLVYPAIYLAITQLVLPFKAQMDEASKKDTMDKMFAKKLVDPDIFNPFTPIPFHNNPELKYFHANLHRRTSQYIDPKLGFNVDDYRWKDYHESFDHNNENKWMYNFTGFHRPIDK